MGLRLDQVPWTPEELETVRRLTEAGHTDREIAATLPTQRTFGAIANIRRKNGMRSPITGRPAGYSVSTVRPVASYAPPEGPTLAEVYAPQVTADETDDEFWARFLKVSRKTVQKAEVQRYATIRIPSDLPIALCISSDWHVGTGADVDGLLSLADFVAKTPGLYSVAVGDLFDNPIKHRGGSVAAVADELRALDLIVGRYRGKLLGTTSGNHDDWSKVLSGTDHLKALAQRHRIHYAPDELLWRVEITAPHDPETVTASYLIATRHQYSRGSRLNPTHACKVWLQEQVCNWESVPDVLAIGHNHVAVIGSEQYSGKDVHFLRMGSFQRDSAYGRALGFPDYRPTAPTVVLPPVQGRIVSFADPQDAVTHLRGWRDAAA